MDPRQMDEDEEMWLNENENIYNSHSENKVKDCYVAVKVKSNPANKKAAKDDAEKKTSKASSTNNSEAKGDVKMVIFFCLSVVAIEFY
jgi:transposase